MGDSGRSRAWTRRARVPRWRVAAGVASVALAGSALAACGTSSAATGPVTLNFYLYPDTSTATDTDHQELQRAEPRQVHDLLPAAARRLRQPATAAGPAAGRARLLDRHHGPGRHLGGRVRQRRLDRAVDRREQGRGRERHAPARAGDRGMEGPARRGAAQQQHPAAVVPLRPGQDPAEDLGPDARRRGAAGEGGQAALHRDPGRPVRGHDRLVQHDERQRGRHHPEPGRDQGHAGRARGQGTVDHEAAGQLARGRPVAGRADGERQPAGHGGRARPRSS